MKTITDLIEDTIYKRKVIPLKFSTSAKPPPRGKYWSNLWDGYSPKLNRDITLYSDLEYYTWIYIESDPEITGFCPQPVYAKHQFEGKIARSLIDFWVLYQDSSEEYWEIKYQADMNKIDNKPLLKRQINIQERWCENNNYTHKIRTDMDLTDKAVTLNNWSRILNILAHSRYSEMKSEMIEVVNNLLLGGKSTLREATFGLEINEGFTAVCTLLTYGLIQLSCPDQTLSWDSKIEASPLWQQ